MDTIADLGLQIDSTSLVAGTAALDRFTASAIRAQRARDGLMASSVSMSQASRDTATAVMSETKASGDSEKAVTRLSSAHRGLSFQSMEAFRATHNLVLGIAGGTSPTYALTRGISELTFAASGPGGLSGAFAGLGKTFGSFLSPTSLMIGAVTAVAGALLYLEYVAVSNGKATQAALLGTGRAAGVTTSQLDDMAKHAATDSDISIGAARSYALEYAASGKITGKSIQDLTALTENYATTTRQSGTDAAKQLTGAFSDLRTGVDTLDKSLGFLDASTRQHILDLEGMGQHEAAVKATIDAMQPSLVQHKTQLTLVGRAWAYIKEEASGALDAIMHKQVPNTQDQLDAAKKKLAELQAGTNATTPLLELFPGAAPALNADQIDKAYSNVISLQKKRSQELADAAKAGTEQYLKSVSLNADQVSGAVLPGLDHIRTLLDQYNQSHLAFISGAVTHMSADQLNAVSQAGHAAAGAVTTLTDAQGKYVVAGKTYSDEHQQELKAIEDEIRGVGARTKEQKGAVAEQNAYTSSIGQTIPKEELLAKMQASRALVIAQMTYAQKIQNATQDLTTESVIKSADAYLRGDIPALVESQALYQARIKALTEDISVTEEQRKLVLKAAADRVNSAAQSLDSAKTEATGQTLANEAVMRGAIGYDQLSQFVSAYSLIHAGENNLKVAEITHNATLIKQAQDYLAGIKQVIAEKAHDEAVSQALQLTHPYDSDLTVLRELNAELEKHQINQQQYLAGVSKTTVNQDLLSAMSGFGQANPFGVSGQLGAQSTVIQAQQQQAQQLQTLQAALEAGLIKSETDAANIRVLINQQAADKIRDAWTGMYSAQLQAGTLAFSSLATGVGAMVGQSSTAYKVLFDISKAFAIADATVQLEGALMKALNTPWPLNIAAIAQVAALGGTILSDIAAIAMPQGHAQGVINLSGPGSSTSDSIMARLSAGESVITASATRKNRGTLTAMNNGASFDSGGGMSGRPAVLIQVEHDGSTAVRYEKVSDGHIRMIAKSVVREDAPGVVAGSQRQPNGVMAQAVHETVRAGRLRR